MAENRKVSIVMATFNRADQLQGTIENIFEQNYQDLELIVVNDGSTDDTLSSLKDIQKTYKFVIVDNIENLGLQKSLNKGIEKASGKYIARIDDHDRWIDSVKISKQVDFLENNPRVGLIGTGYETKGKSMVNPLTDSEIRKQILMRSPFCHVSVLMLKSIVDKVGGYNEDLSYSEDWELWLKMGKHTEFANLPDIMVAVKEEDLSLTGTYFLKQLPINRKIVKQYFKEYPNSTKAFFYHQFIRFFFALVPLNGSIHKWMKKIFLNSFDLISKRKT